jgi:23S rRNA pseudouridine1911/1915/1917 synthase
VPAPLRAARLNAGCAYQDAIGREDQGRSVLDFLASRYRHSDAAVWQTRLLGGEVTLNGLTARATDRLAPGQRLVWNRPPWEEPAVPLSFALLYRDTHLLAVAKPRGLPTLPNGGFLEHTLLHCVRRHWPEATPVHRLGRGTSGLVLFARSAEARRAVAAAWRLGQVTKIYRALVTGQPADADFTIATPIGRLPHPRLGEVYAAATAGAGRGARPALSHVHVLARRGTQALVEVTIPTGRPHQIRIHLAAAGHPLVGDPLYVTGGVPASDPGLPGDLGYWLHAHRLGLDHPLTGRRLALECAPPEELSVGCQVLH